MPDCRRSATKTIKRIYKQNNNKRKNILVKLIKNIRIYYW